MVNDSKLPKSQLLPRKRGRKCRTMNRRQPVSAVQDLQELREMKTLSKRNVALSAFQDTKKTLKKVEHQVKEPHFHHFILSNNFI